MNASDRVRASGPPYLLRAVWVARLLSPLLIGVLTACGGGGSSQTPPPKPDFTLAVDPTTQSVSSANSGSVTLSATALDGFSPQIGVQVTGVPSGVSTTPASFNLQPGTQQKVTFSAIPVATGGAQTVTFTGVSGSLTHTAQLSLMVTGVSGQLPVRTHYVRTDATTEYFLWNNQHWIVYDSALVRYFVTDPSSNQVIVIDGASQTKLSTIGVPGAFGIDETPDRSTLYVGTLIGDVYALDPAAMTVKKRYPAAEIGGSGFPASFALVLSDGRLALSYADLTYRSNPGGIAIWNPATNAITIYGGTLGPQTECGNGIGFASGFTLNADRTQILLGSGGTLCEIDPSTGASVYTTATGAELTKIVVTADGKYFILAAYLTTAQPNTAVVVDAHTFTVLGEFSVLGDAASASGFFVSADSKTLFIPGDPATGLIYAYDLATQQLAGWVPNIFIEPISGGGAPGPINSPYLLVNDGTGLFAGPLEEGIGFVDVSALQTGALGTQFNNSYTPPLKPATGPASGGTPTQWSDLAPVPLESIYFGVEQATGISTNPGITSGFANINATSPSGLAGPVDVYLFTTDGGMQLLPEAFNYGPTILEVSPNMSTAEGGGIGYIYGYGFGPANSTSIPSDLSVTVNGVSVPVKAFVGNAYNSAYPPFPLESVAYTIPPGTNGTTVSVAVSTGSGTATLSNGLTYLPASQQFSLTGSALAQGIYDPHTGLYYFTDTTQIQIFSRAQGKWLTPIPIAPPAGTSERLWGIALSPNGTLMAIADASAGVIYLLNPASPTSVKTFSLASQPLGENLPCGVAVSDLGMVYYTTVGQGFGGARQFFKLDTNTGKITDYGIAGPDVNGDSNLRVVISSDNSKVFFNNDGDVFSIDTATDKISPAAFNGQCCYGNYEMALASNQAQLTASFDIYDFDLNGESYYALNDREILNTLYVYGAKFSPDGRLVLQPSASGIDVFGNGTGNLQDRISLPHSLSPNYDALVVDGADNLLIGITGTGDGIAVIDLTSINEPQPLPHERFTASPSLRFENHSERLVPRHKSLAYRPNQRSLNIKHLTRSLHLVK